MPDNNSTTQVQEVDLDLNSLLAGSDQVMTPDNKDASKLNIFARADESIPFIDKNDDSNSTTPAVTTTPASTGAGQTTTQTTQGSDPGTSEPATTIDALLDNAQNTPGTDDPDEDPKKKGGRPSNLVELTNKLIEKKIIVPFDDDKPIDKYTLSDFEELYEANNREAEKRLQEEVAEKFFDALPQELQYAAKYVADGGTNLKDLFRTLAQVEDNKTLDITKEKDQEQIIRQYLQATNFGTSEDIEEEINGWKDREELENKAKKFKPKLDAMQEQIVAKELQKQEALRKQYSEQAKIYQQNIYSVLEPAEINGLKLDRKTQNNLYAGLTQANYPSRSGRSTNLLGHLLEKYQFVEPRHDLIAEALWLLSDPDGYKDKVREIAKKETTAQTIRGLKFEEGNKKGSSSQQDEKPENRASNNRDRISRPSQNFFKR